MLHAFPRRLQRLTVASMTPLEPTADAVAMRQLRHQTKNALQRILARVAAADLRLTPAGNVLADEIERSIFLSARISDALFGFTAAPGPLDRRLATLSDAMVALLADQEQTIRTEICVTGSCPEAMEATVIQVAHEMLGNAIKHGMHMRLVGRIVIQLLAQSDGAVTLLVSDDGWGFGDTGEGDGLPIMRSLAERHGGTVALSRKDGWTVGRLHLPGPA